MTHSPDEIRGMHRALHVACGLPALSPGYTDLAHWRDFLAVLAPLAEDTEEGRLTVSDIQDVVGEMKRQNKAGQAKWSLRPSKLLRDPELFRDLVLFARERRRQRPARPTTREATQQIAGTSRTVEVPAEEDPIDVRKAFSDLRRSLTAPKQ